MTINGRVDRLIVDNTIVTGVHVTSELSELFSEVNDPAFSFSCVLKGC